MQVELSFSKEALYAIAEQASGKKTGARGLRSIMVSYYISLVVWFGKVITIR